jgi:ribosome-binding factor A
MRHRVERVNNLIRDELSKILSRELEFPGSLVTIIEVETNKDMKGAKVRLSVLPSEKSAQVLRSLNDEHDWLQHLLLQRINIKPMPKIVFEIDHNIKEIARIEEL